METPFGPSGGKRRTSWLAALLIVFAAARIATTYRVLSETADEFNHIGAGLDLIGQHRYIVQPANPPLARVVLAAVPYLSGMRYDPFTTRTIDIFYGHGKYTSNLARARVGNLLFFALAAAGVWLLARQTLDDDNAALLALLLFTTQPIVLGYSGLANHDAAATAGVAVALLAFLRWMRAPTLANAAILGVAYGFAALCKFSCLLFVPAACAAIFLLRLRRENLRALATIWIVPLTGFLTLWAGYAFTIGKFDGYAYLPAPAFWKGMSDLIEIERGGFFSYALGRRTMTGWWWYFPFAFGVKTTIALLLLLAGGWWAVRSTKFRRPFLEWSAAGVAIIVPAMTSSLDLGVRYILPAFVPFSIAAGAVAIALWRSPHRVARAVAAVLICWHLGASLLAHPDYFPYFNEIAMRRPQDFLADSNLDWGQDVLRLGRFCRRHHVTGLAFYVTCAGYPPAMGVPPKIEVDWWSSPPSVPAAISEGAILGARTNDPGALAWADRLPFVRIGTSIRVYNVDQ